MHELEPTFDSRQPTTRIGHSSLPIPHSPFRILHSAFCIAALAAYAASAADKEEWAKEHVVYRLESGDLLFTGNQSRAALHAVYAFLDRELGVRWLWPGEDGAFFLARRTWEFPKKFGFDNFRRDLSAWEEYAD